MIEYLRVFNDHKLGDKEIKNKTDSIGLIPTSLLHAGNYRCNEIKE